MSETKAEAAISPEPWIADPVAIQRRLFQAVRGSQTRIVMRSSLPESQRSRSPQCRSRCRNQRSRSSGIPIIELIAKLYAVESRARKLEMNARQRLNVRQEHSVPVIEAIEALLLAHLHAVVPGSALGKALHYFSSQWPKLVRYVEDGRYPIDNNPCENSIRPFVVGRKGWLFSDTVAGANASANLYSLVQTCKANGIDSYRYLRALFVALPNATTVDDYEALLPWRITLPAQ